MAEKKEKKEKKWERVEHTFPPVCDAESRILILGTAPSVKSREAGFYYGHPQNRFWKTLAKVTGDSLPETTEEKKAFLLRNHIAVYDVLQSCDIVGSSDSSIKNAVPADLSVIFRVTGKLPVFLNGGTAYRLYQKYQEKTTGTEGIKLPSTSPANAAWKLDMLTEAWGRAILPYLK